MSDTTGWHEFAHVVKSTTHIAYIYENGSAYFPEGPTVVGPDDFTYAAARGKVHRLVRADEYEGWRPPARVIEDPAELDALPAGSVVMMTTWMRRAFVHAGGGRWWVAGPIRSEISAAEVLDGCAVVVLHAPENGDTP
ncbi:hypothetical protein [Nocardia fusca]|uniref:Uncharacterized protein n=1 Tax=Nocardia fusca TaxID=941183 RepID=A0ABV3FIV8_9NOCA